MIGIFENMAEAEYHARKEVSKSMLDDFNPPRRYWWNYVSGKAEPREQTAAMRFGSAIHARVLTPDIYKDAVAIAEPKLNRRMKDWSAFESANGGKVCLTYQEGMQVEALRESVMQYRPARRLLELDSKREISAFWQDETGIGCRGRVDLAETKNGILVDLKTTADASPDKFTRSIFDYRYHVQAAYYLDGLAKTGAADFDASRDWPFIWICVEKEAPFCVGVWAADETMIARGREIYRRELDALKKCIDDDFWPSYRDDAETLRLPRWAMTDNVLTVEI